MLVIASLLVSALAKDLDLNAPATSSEIAAKINAMNTTWKAHESPRFKGLKLKQVKQLCGTFLKDHKDYKALPEKEGSNYDNIANDIPDNFDSRTNWPKCPSIGHIRDQSSCGSCWAFGSTEAFNDRRCISTGDTTLLSPDDTTACCGFLQCSSMGCNGGQPGMAWRWFTTHGVVTGGDYGEEDGGTCLPYSLKPCAHHVKSSKYGPCPSQEYPTPRCSKKCSDSKYGKSYSDDKKNAKKAYGVSGVLKIQTDIMTYGPVTGAFTVYSDFPNYKSGVYKHTSGSALGGHAIKIIGWGVEDGQDYWLVVNSWNESWGDNGTFKIARGNDECGIESQISAGQV
mmetsp:Transcript_12214/g.19940  ORF Transcript_12214/g.19940 Transcript_12214/m.19940 type:complete len:341 (+) Transcript_12214:34-1056(+)|eukprot:jgi/Bigna1/50554/estExt_Genewise1.C_820075